MGIIWAIFYAIGFLGLIGLIVGGVGCLLYAICWLIQKYYKESEIF
jgi:hypothetical protein